MPRQLRRWTASSDAAPFTLAIDATSDLEKGVPTLAAGGARQDEHDVHATRLASSPETPFETRPMRLDVRKVV